MKQLFDENLSPKLITLLANIFPNAAHVERLNLCGASDNDVWEYHANINIPWSAKTPISTKKVCYKAPKVI